MQKNEVKRRRIKIIYCCAIIITIVSGLCSRAYAEYLPEFASAHLGDALWAAMVYFGFRLLLSRCSMAVALGLSMLFSFSIEFSQLYQAAWINEVRATLAGGLILGRGFLWIDLLRYTAGICGACILDRLCLNRASPVINKPDGDEIP
ncbi:ribosomal maturation YjgA family protein [Paenibacillus typhae]|uniref:ribosomal maturation YjgA family protein n=1 Tax=Paenibacillus typhae TaxID=1174501 RepID=UPI001C8CFD51|nr:DUF2809 domain-containing protein [Paenibacillus typhae]MBY0013338.1 DUF2809 domain-containing protein [Paenibacillus typhae]